MIDLVSASHCLQNTLSLLREADKSLTEEEISRALTSLTSEDPLTTVNDQTLYGYIVDCWQKDGVLNFAGFVKAVCQRADEIAAIKKEVWLRRQENRDKFVTPAPVRLYLAG